MHRKILICALLLATARSMSAQQINPATPPPPPPQEKSATPPVDPSAPPPRPSADAPSAAPIDPSTPPPPPSADAPDATPDPSVQVFDPLHAERSVDVGTFYLKAGKIDAAIERFVEASNYEPSLAKPWKFLGEAYEKKGAYSHALESYKKYLELLPGAEDARKVQKRISLLEEKVEKESPKTAAH